MVNRRCGHLPEHPLYPYARETLDSLVVKGTLPPLLAQMRVGAPERARSARR